MNQAIYPCIWFNKNAAEAAAFYASVFPDAVITSDTGVVVTLALSGQKFMLLNGGPQFQINPSLSFVRTSTDPAEVDTLWNKLSAGGQVLMDLGSYPWSSRYGWVQDQYGVSWQLYTTDQPDVEQPYIPAMIFTGKQNGRAAAAIRLYTSIFPDSKELSVLKYEAGGEDPEGNVQHAAFVLDGYQLSCMDSARSHPFGFNEGGSLVVECSTQQEIDKYWEALIADGGMESRCGWLKDKFGFSWQVVPAQVIKLMTAGDPEKSDRMMQALMKMKKLDIAALEAAYHGKS